MQRGVEILIVTSWYGNQEKLRPDGPLCSCAVLTLFSVVSASTDVCLFIVNIQAIQQSLDLLVPSILQISVVKMVGVNHCLRHLPYRHCTDLPQAQTRP